MSAARNQTTFFKLDGGYTITLLSARCNSYILRNADKVLATMVEDDERVIQLNSYQNYVLTEPEKKLLQHFIREHSLKLGNEVAASLDLSALRYADGREEYVVEQVLKNRLREPLEAESVYVGKLRQHTLTIPDFAKGGVYNLSRAQITKLVVGDNCDLLLDLRENEDIEAVRVGESFNGGINLSRSTVESITIANNSRCDLAIFDSKRCFTLNIADVYSGNLNVKNSCFHSLNIGYYSYAAIHLTDNWGRRDVTIGDSFRGTLNLEGVNVYGVRLGKDCKGTITVNSLDKAWGSRRVIIGNDFSGVLDLRSSESVEELLVGEHARGKFNLCGSRGIRKAEFGRYFSGYADFSESAVEYINLAEGSSGEMILQSCENLKLVKLPQHKSSTLAFTREPVEVRHENNAVYYHFIAGPGEGVCCPPLYQKIYKGVKEMLTSHSN